jgi:hypothetical protein
MAYKQPNDVNSLLGLDPVTTTYSNPVFLKDLEGEIKAEANTDGTTFVDKSLSAKDRIECKKHEDIHHEQMKSNRLSYDNKNVYWKKDTKAPMKIYPREKMAEGAHDLEWEQEAHAVHKTVKK